ncbi:MAG: PKD domain-containing protein, partial [Ginsengibacter sp.]
MRRLLSVFIFVCLSGIVRGQTISPAGPLALCPGGSKILTVTGPKPGTTFQWLKNNSRIVNATSVSYTISAAGSYSVVLGGLAAVDTLGPVVVIIASVPVASFTFSPSATQCGNTPITFTSTSSGTGLSYVWQFSDPNSGANNMVATSAVSAVHKFKGNPGNGTQTFTVKLVATNSTGCKDSTTQQVTIKQVPGPTLDGTGQIPFQGTIYFTQCGTTASLFSFTNQSAYPSSSNYKIIWGDTAADFDSPTFPPVLNHLYEVGNYTLKFIFTGINGCPDTTIYGVFVGDAPYGGIGTDNNQLSGCTGTVLSFPFLDAVFTNPAGTFYYLSVDDGTPVTVYNQPPPASFSHQFNNPSCGVGGNNSNAFTVSVLITNPCSISGVRGTISPIKISQTPSANFNIAKDTLCVNQTTTITDISANNFINQAGLCVLGKSVWSITPGVQNVDWTIVSGSLGNYNNSSVPSTWTAGSSVLNLRFINPGSYTVKLKTGGSDKCGIDSISKSICVNPLPKINFSFSSDTLCASLTDTVLYTPSTEYCGKNMYEWYVTKYTPAAGCFPNTSSYTYVDGTSDTSANPHFKFSSPGTYQIQLFAYSPGRACFNQMVKNVVVKGVPSISLPANAGVCQNQPLGFSNTVSCYTGSASYNWMFPGSSTPSSNLANPPPVSYANAGMYTITVGVTNECGTSTSVQKLIVDTLVLAYAGPDTTLCGSSVAMSANSPGIANGKWSVISGPNTPAITSPSSPSTTITGLVQGTYIFQWKISNGGCADSSTVTIKISGGPSIANAGPDQQLCLDTVATFAANTPAIGIGKWSFISGPNTPVIANMASAISVVNNLIPGVYTFTWTINFSNCSPNIDTIRITIYDSPTVADAGADQTICVSSTTLKGNFPSTGTGQWFFINGPGLPVTTDSSLSSTTVTGLVSGTYNFRWNISNGACLASNDTVQVVVSTIANNTISGNQSVCINSIPATITGSLPTGGNGNYNYLWQQSKDSTITWTDIAGATNASYSPGTLT